MKKLKIIAIALCMLFATGCDTPTDSSAKFNTILYVVQHGVTFSTTAYLKSVDADKRDLVVSYITETAVIIDEAVTSGIILPEQFRAHILRNLDNRVPQPYNAAIIGVIELAVKGYNKFYAANVKDSISNNPKAIQVIKSIVIGLKLGVDPVGSDPTTTSNPLESYDNYKL
jgi:uncharacterized lipoprotein YajG